MAAYLGSKQIYLPKRNPQSQYAEGNFSGRALIKLVHVVKAKTQKSSPSKYLICFRGLKLRIHQEKNNGPLRLRPEIGLRVELTKKGDDHTGAYLPLESLGQDEPARRLAFRVNAKTVDAKQYIRWLKSKRSNIQEVSIKNHNDVVAQLEAANGKVKDSEEEKKERRKRKREKLEDRVNKRL